MLSECGHLWLPAIGCQKSAADGARYDRCGCLTTLQLTASEKQGDVLDDLHA